MQEQIGNPNTRPTYNIRGSKHPTSTQDSLGSQYTPAVESLFTAAKAAQETDNARKALIETSMSESSLTKAEAQSAVADAEQKAKEARSAESHARHTAERAEWCANNPNPEESKESHAIRVKETKDAADRAAQFAKLALQIAKSAQQIAQSLDQVAQSAAEYVNDLKIKYSTELAAEKTAAEKAPAYEKVAAEADSAKATEKTASDKPLQSTATTQVASNETKKTKTIEDAATKTQKVQKAQKAAVKATADVAVAKKKATTDLSQQTSTETSETKAHKTTSLPNEEWPALNSLNTKTSKPASAPQTKTIADVAVAKKKASADLSKQTSSKTSKTETHKTTSLSNEEWPTLTKSKEAAKAPEVAKSVKKSATPLPKSSETIRQELVDKILSDSWYNDISIVLLLRNMLPSESVHLLNPVGNDFKALSKALNIGIKEWKQESSYTHAVMPINLGYRTEDQTWHGSHWVALVIQKIVDANGHMHLKALYNDSYATPMSDKIEKILRDNAVGDITDFKIQQQLNGYDCGPWTVFNIHSMVIRNQPANPKDVNDKVISGQRNLLEQLYQDNPDILEGFLANDIPPQTTQRLAPATPDQDDIALQCKLAENPTLLAQFLATSTYPHTPLATTQTTGNHPDYDGDWTTVS